MKHAPIGALEKYMFAPLIKIATLLVLYGSILLLPDLGHAQAIKLGGDDEQIFKVLHANGYTNPRITKRDLTIIRTEACKGRDKYQVKVSILGKITSVQRIGTCAAAPPARFTSAQAVRAMQGDGYSAIEARRTGDRIIGVGCRSGKRYQLSFSQNGQMINRIIMGRCADPGLTNEQITDILRNRGYRQIQITNDQPPRYMAEACREASRVRLSLNPQGAIRSERIIGNCRRPIDPANIVSILENQGFKQVVVVNRRRPPYVATGCRRSDRFEVEIGRYGSVRNQKRIGSCAKPIDPANLTTMLEKQGFNRVQILRGSRAPFLVEVCNDTTLLELTITRFGKIESQERVGRCVPRLTRKDLREKYAELGYLNVRLRRTSSGWTALACQDESELTIRLDAFGERVSERKTGVCEATSSLDLLKTLESRGAQQTELYVEGCYRGKKYRWSYDRLGNRTGRNILGDC